MTSCPQQFQVYWFLAQTEVEPPSWPAKLSPLYNLTAPGVTTMNGSAASFYFSTAPPFMRPPGWTADEDAVLNAFATGESGTLLLLELGALRVMGELRRHAVLE